MGQPGTRLLSLSLPMPVKSLSWSPDGRYLVAAGTTMSGSSNTGGKIAILDTHGAGPPKVLDRAEPTTDSAAVSADGRWLAVGGATGKGVLAMPDGAKRCVNDEMGHADKVVFSPDGQFVGAVGWSSGFAAGPLTWVFDAATGETVWRSQGSFDMDHMGLTLANSPDGRFIAAVMGGKSFLFDAVNGDQLKTLPEFVHSVAFTPDSNWVVAGMTDGRCLVVAVDSDTVLETRVHARVGLSSVAVSADGRWVATILEPGPAVLGTKTARLRFGPRTDLNEGTRVVFGPDLRTIAVNQLPGEFPRPGVALLDAATGKDIWSDQCPDIARDLAFSPDGGRIAIGGIVTEQEGYLRIYDTGTERVRIERGSPVTNLALSSSADPVLAIATKDQNVRSYRVRTGGEPLVEGIHPSPVTSVAVSPDGLFVATGCLDGNARMFKSLFGQLWVVGHGQAVNAVAVSAAGDLVATACADRTARVLALADGKELAKCVHQGGVTAVVFSQDGTLLATGSNRTTTIVDAGTGQATHTVTGAGPVRALAFSRGGLLATGNQDGLVQVVDPASGTVLGVVTHPRPIGAVAFSPNGALLATGGADQTVRLSQLTDGVPTELRTLRLDAPVTGLEFHPVDAAIAVLTERPTISVFETETGEERYRAGHPAVVRDLAFTADGTLLVTACDDGAVRVFDGRTS